VVVVLATDVSEFKRTLYHAPVTSNSHMQKPDHRLVIELPGTAFVLWRPQKYCSGEPAGSYEQRRSTTESKNRDQQ
jgi:hypothetical protein